MAWLEKQLVVKKSQIPGSGKGLYTRADIAKGACICEYKGRIQPWKDVKHEDGYNGYLMRINRQQVINGLNYKKTFARYANDASGIAKIKGLRNNAVFITDGKRCFLEAKRTILKNEEILAGYGKEYWILIRKIRREAKKI
ncbi:MAG: SET domain-containing protein-lysine N-methyltransferase [Azospira oryzae]|jgi:hypothetical protein|nr:MAG: SET domain-containing protein-lysine N-methyltransferase [Azospira oryzae]